MAKSYKTRFEYVLGNSGKSHGHVGKVTKVKPMGEVVNIVAKYRDSHHRIAQMLAIGCTPSFIRQHTGISIRRLTLLGADPTFQELIIHYSKVAEEKLAQTGEEYIDLLRANMLRGEQHVADAFERAEDEGELIPIAVADKISQGRADRLGYGKNMTIEHKHDFATLLDKAVKRSEQARLIEGTTAEGPSLRALPAQTTSSVVGDAARPPPSGAASGDGGPVRHSPVPHFPRRRLA